MSDEILEIFSEKNKKAVRMRSKGHTYSYIAKKLGYENPVAAQDAIATILKTASVASLSSVDSGFSEIDGEFNTIYEVRIRLTTKGGYPRTPHFISQLMQALYETEAEWEKETDRYSAEYGSLLQEPTTFSVSKVMIDQAPQTGKHIIFPEV